MKSTFGFPSLRLSRAGTCPGGSSRSQQDPHWWAGARSEAFSTLALLACMPSGRGGQESHHLEFVHERPETR